MTGARTRKTHSRRRPLALAALIVVAVAQPALTERQPRRVGPPDPPIASTGSQMGPNRYQKNLERWQSLTPDQRDLFRARYREFQRLSIEQRQTLQSRYEQYERLETPVQRLCRANWEVLARLSTQEKRRVKELFRAVQKMPPDKRRQLAQLYKAFKQRTVAQRADLLKRLADAKPPTNRRALIHEWIDRTRPTSAPAR